MKAIVLNDHFVNSISKALVVVPNKQQKTVEIIFTEDGRQDLRMCINIPDAKELRDSLISAIADFTLPKTTRLPKL